MCGIYGVFHFVPSGAPCEPLLAAMGQVIDHRGPDDHGHYEGQGIGLGMRRLSIIDVAGGHQPISNEDGTVWIVLNGEIYNFRDLRTELERKGHQFRTRTDTEVLVHLYEEEGVGFFTRLRGMFGLALWDSRHERLILGRDRIGEKPLYFRREVHRVLFSSELKSILQVEGVPRNLNLVALQEYLALGYVPAPLSMFEGIDKLLPGHFLIIEKDRFEDHEYWDIACGKVDARSEEEWVDCIREKLLETVQAQLVSDVPLGAFLSGGIDSSTIVAAMSRLTGQPVNTYAIGYEDEHSYFNELEYAKLVAKAFGTEHHEIIVRPELSELFPKLIWHLDEPVADSAFLTTYLVSRLARQTVTVILSGVGGDELFGGYRRYLGNSLQRWFRLLPGFVRRKVLPSLLNRVPQDRSSLWKDYSRYAAAFVRTADLDPMGQYMSYVTVLSEDVQNELLKKHNLSDTQDSPEEIKIMRSYFERGRSNSPLNQIMYVDLKTSLPDDLLALTDRMSMAASIECRAPLVDYELVELAFRMPSSLKVRGFTLKHALKKAVAPWLPREVIERKKRGFGAPVAAWLRRELRPLLNELLSKEAVERRGLFHWPTIETILSAHEEQRRDCTDQLLALLVLEVWCRNYLDREGPPVDLSKASEINLAASANR